MYTASVSDKERKILTKSRRVTVASSKPSESKTSKITSSSSDMESSEAETGRKAGGRHGNKEAASAMSTTVSPRCLCLLLRVC